MKIDSDNLVPISDTNKNFSKAPKITYEKSSLIILKTIRSNTFFFFTKR